MTMTFRKFSVLFGFVAAFIGCESKAPDYLKLISPTELNQALQGEDIFLVDVHTPEQRHIKGTDVFVPYDQVVQYQDRFPKDKATTIYLYCESGRMANTAAETLHRMGYENLVNLEGGEKAWRQNGFALE